jgi:hypothetical protein
MYTLVLMSTATAVVLVVVLLIATLMQLLPQLERQLTLLFPTIVSCQQLLVCSATTASFLSLLVLFVIVAYSNHAVVLHTCKAYTYVLHDACCY